jgi:hypothetical protein
MLKSFTGLKGKIKVKDEFIPMIKDLISLIDSEKEEDELIWKSIYNKYKYEWLKDYSELQHADFIPFGELMEHTDWLIEKKNELIENEWNFTCEVKNENEEVSRFISLLEIICVDGFQSEISVKFEGEGILINL